ncbi:hypothetical protein BD410DRAFT_843719 [Rickenella mellea]|uniref:Uncharacterized protein n=1 Tax=Rickenella mellea TaxID=50990 RepID=A0A4Y7PQE9_9AGAM|nr:hypothetical protein BD410DRAFT_843719 [Rickenella mellea]
MSPSTTTSSVSRRHPRPVDHPQHRENIPKDVGYQNLQFSWPFRASMDGIEGGDHREDLSEETMALATVSGEGSQDPSFDNHHQERVPTHLFSMRAAQAPTATNSHSSRQPIRHLLPYTGPSAPAAPASPASPPSPRMGVQTYPFDLRGESRSPPPPPPAPPPPPPSSRTSAQTTPFDVRGQPQLRQHQDHYQHLSHLHARPQPPQHNDHTPTTTPTTSPIVTHGYAGCARSACGVRGEPQSPPLPPPPPPPPPPPYPLPSPRMARKQARLTCMDSHHNYDQHLLSHLHARDVTAWDIQSPLLSPTPQTRALPLGDTIDDTPTPPTTASDAVCTQARTQTPATVELKRVAMDTSRRSRRDNEELKSVQTIAMTQPPACCMRSA